MMNVTERFKGETTEITTAVEDNKISVAMHPGADDM
jgi:hypothetical protein